jgi:SWI/SNF-related matrix-associated actin-dependent regulator 1 of chromatin subfamily A
MTELYPYQKTGAAWLAERPRALLADDMGLGKSAQAIAVCDATGAMEVLVICPASVIETWKREFRKFSRMGIVPQCTSYEGATKYDSTSKSTKRFDVLVLDECHYLKTPTSKRTRAIFGERCDGVGGLIERADRVICLSGTPMPNNPAELWPALRALAPETITSSKSGRPYSYWQFVAKYCRTVDKGFGQQIVGAKNHGQLAEAIRPFMLRRLKADVLKDLPPIRFDTLYVHGQFAGHPEGIDRQAYIAEEEELIRATLESKGVEGLRSIAAHVATLRRYTGLAKAWPAAEWIKTWLDCCNDKLVVFAHHQDVIQAIYKKVCSTEYMVALLSGATSHLNRMKAIDAFQNNPKCRIFLGQIQAAGTGITLTASSDVLFVESSWVPAENQQAAMRVHRIGQAKPCLARFATLAGSIDEQIQKAVARKTADISQVLDVEN